MLKILTEWKYIIKIYMERGKEIIDFHSLKKGLRIAAIMSL
jgi:hypothetical protein